METINFRLPPQQQPGEDAFDTRPAAVRQWIAELPLGNLSETARLLYGALRETNRLILPLEHRLTMLEAMAPALHTVLGTLQQKMAAQPLPLSAQTRRISEFSAQLLAEVVIAYQAVLDGQQQGSWLFRLTHHELWPLCIHRMLHYLGHISRVHRLVHLPNPTGLWQAMHRLFLEADNHGRRSELLQLPWDKSRHESIEQSYLQQHLIALLDPSLLSPVELDKVLTGMPGWAMLATLRAPADWQPALPAYWIRLDLDSPHTSAASQTSAQEHEHSPALLLDLGALQNSLEQHLAGKSVNTSSLEVLRRAWQAPVGPRETRSHSHAKFQAAIGISALFSLLRTENRHRRDGISDQQFSDELKPLLAIASKPTASPAKPATNVWDNIFFATELSGNSWSMDSQEMHYHYISAQEHDASDSGSCLEFQVADLPAIDVGELLGLRHHPGGAMQLCELRWVQQKQDRILTGVMVLANELEAILTVMQEQQQRTALAGLLGIGRDGHPQLFLPNLPGLAQRQLSLVVDGCEVPIVLHQRSAISPLFIAYHFGLHPSLKDAQNLDVSMNLDDLKQRLHQLTQHPPSPNKQSKDDFSDLWDSL